MSGTSVVKLNMEKLDSVGSLSTASWRAVHVTETVSTILDRSPWHHEWRQYRLAIGVQIYQRPPTSLKWTKHNISAEYDPTIEELFGDIILQGEEVHYLLLSRLNVQNRYNPGHAERVERALYRFQGLYMHMSRVDVH